MVSLKCTIQSGAHLRNQGGSSNSSTGYKQNCHGKIKISAHFN